MSRRQHPFSALASTIARRFGGEAGAGLLLIAVAAFAMIAANSPWADAWHELFHHQLRSSPIARLDSLHAWINDGLMALFFFVVGLEIKREILQGQLSHPARRRLPVLAAGCGMIGPALVFLAVTRGAPQLTPGWAIPAATDIAFAVGVLALLGPGLPPSLRLFLLTVAIVDDLGAVAIIAVAYSSNIDASWLALGAGLLGVLGMLARAGVKRGWPYALGGLLLWYAVLHSGIHATVAGVLAAMTVPIDLDRDGESLLLRMEHVLAPVSAYLIVPAFGLANAGVNIAGAMPPDTGHVLPVGIGLGLLLGKTAGIFGAVYLAERAGLAARPTGASWAQVLGIAALCGIGFTMSLFIAGLAFPADPALVETAKLGIFGGSLVSGMAGLVLLRLSAR